MGWRQFRGWLRQMRRLRDRAAGRNRTDPDSWDGYANDAFWTEQRRRRAEIRGH